jgi:hypothetical protein
MAETAKNECRFRSLCRFGGSGCSGESLSNCYQAEVIKRSEEKLCPAFSPESCAKCDIPKYRALLNTGSECGVEGRCFVREVLRGMIPLQDIDCGQVVPKKYYGVRKTMSELRKVLNKNGM